MRRAGGGGLRVWLAAAALAAATGASCAAPPARHAADAARAPAMAKEFNRVVHERAGRDAADPAARMVHKAGHIELRVTRPADALREVAAIAEAAGGYVERQSGARITVRIPGEDFDGALDRVVELGEVVSRSVTATDVTDAFVAADLRRRTAEATRERLLDLLARATDEQVKLQLLREIQRLSEQIERLDAEARTLAALAAMARLTVEARGRDALEPGVDTPEVRELAWIHELSPFRREVARRGHRLTLEAPRGMVALGGESFAAESADGAALWTCRLPNRPRGDTAFWVEALRVRLAPGFAEAEVVTLGDYEALRLVDHGDDPYVYLVGVRAVGAHLGLVEVYYPSAEHEERHGPAVEAALGGPVLDAPDSVAAVPEGRSVR